ncbi:hypothetical protein [Streptomyces galilaeus]|uniref:hypothetical protein n=1 Tax=Streptomyces galilaeus TaxID=33899 RepID=UPI0038F647E7
MPDYKISYDNGRSEHIQAASAYYDAGESQYHFVDEAGQDKALVPSINVLSVVREDAEAVDA